MEYVSEECEKKREWLVFRGRATVIAVPGYGRIDVPEAAIRLGAGRLQHSPTDRSASVLHSSALYSTISLTDERITVDLGEM